MRASLPFGVLAASAFLAPVPARTSRAGENEVVVKFQPNSVYVDVPAKLNDTLDVTFRLDTGAMKTCIDRATVKKLGIEITPLTPRVPVSGVHAASFQPVVELQKVAVGGAVVSNLMVIVIDSKIGGTVGLLGMDFLKYFKHEMDTPNGVLKITARQVTAEKEKPDAGNNDAAERRVRLQAVDRELYRCINELNGIIAKVSSSRSAAGSAARAEFSKLASEAMNKIVNDPTLRSQGTSSVAQQTTQLAGEVAEANEAAKKAIDGAITGIVAELVEEQAHVFVIAADIHRNHGDEAGAWFLYRRGSRYGKGAFALEAGRKAGEIEARCGKGLAEAKLMMKMRKYGAAAERLIGIADGFPDSPMAEDATKVLRMYERDRKIGPKIAYARAVLAAKRGDTEEAKKLYEDVKKRYPASLEALKAARDLRALK